ncbi:Thoeris anti-defense Tad2 family protein [Streptomyces albidoflavus]|uniref:Thoeris anti-defense Tad2 family protein n=1 Tax=Streptomyces albidoflavus TaxID=1886 RepID=UPI0033F256FD
MDFSAALLALKGGAKVARASWKNPGKYVVLHPGGLVAHPLDGSAVREEEHLMWRNDTGRYVPWMPSQDAVLAADWFLGESGQYIAPQRDRRPPD